MNKLLENSISSIQIGVEDYFSNDTKRITSCVRNLFSGILLLFKSRLLDLSPADSDEVLIKQDIVPFFEGGKIIFKGKGKKTIDVNDIKIRFDSLKIRTDWTVIDKIQAEKNFIEHYYNTSNIATLKSLITNTFNIANEFIRNELSLDPKELFGDTWKKMLEIKEVYLNEKTDCENKIDDMFDFEDIQMIVVKYFYCNNCGSEIYLQ